MPSLTRRSLLANMALAPLMAAEEKPNVLFVVSDDQNCRLGCFGAEVKSPTIDGLARGGMAFDHAYCQYPLCNPSRSSLLTGRRPLTTQILDNGSWFRDTLPDVVTLPQHFRANGYWTATTGKVFHVDDNMAWDVGGDPPKRPPRPAQERHRNQTADQHRNWLDHISPKALAERERDIDRWTALDGDGHDHPDYQTATDAIDLLDRRPKDRPFFLAVGFANPHAPFIGPRKYFDLYDPARIELPPDFVSWPANKTLSYRPNADIFIKREATPELARQAIAGYYAATSFMDAQFGRVLARLDAQGLRHNTVIVFFGDNGFMLGQKGLWAKESLFDEAERVPLIFSVPWLHPASRVFSRPVEFLDIYPTLCEICGLSLTAGLEGASFAPLLKNPSAHWDKPAYTYMRWGNVIGRSVRTERYRYTEWDHGKLGTEMFDYQTDPAEMHDLAAGAKYASIAAKLKALLAALP